MFAYELLFLSLALFYLHQVTAQDNGGRNDHDHFGGDGIGGIIVCELLNTSNVMRS